MVDPASSNPRCLRLGVYRLHPPYNAFLSVGDPATLEATPLTRGTILVLGVEQVPPMAAAALDSPENREIATLAAGLKSSQLAPALVDRVRDLRSRFPAHPIVLRLGSVSERYAVEIGRLAAEHRVRGILIDGEDVEASLRRQLTGREHLVEDFLAWLSCCTVRLSDFSRFVIERIFRAALQHEPLSKTVRQLGVGSESTIRDRFRIEGLPSPRKWRRLAEALYAVLWIQRETGSLFAQARELGYSDASALSHQLAGVFSARPGTIRQTIGWEWWAHVWLLNRKARGEFSREC